MTSDVQKQKEGSSCGKGGKIGLCRCSHHGQAFWFFPYATVVMCYGVFKTIK